MDMGDASGNESQSFVKPQALRAIPRDLCLTCAQPCSETEWKFSIEDGLDLGAAANGASRFGGESGFQVKNGKEEKVSKYGRVLYRRPRRGVPCS